MTAPGEPPRLLISHHVHRWHGHLVPATGGPIYLEHRATGERRSVAEPLWQALERALARPAAAADCVAALVQEGFDPALAEAEVGSLARARFLVDPADDFWDDFCPDLVPRGDAAPGADLARDRLRFARDAIDPLELWMYPRWLGRTVLQWPPDLFLLQQLLAELRPEFVVETGVFDGGSALYYASILELLGRGEVVGIELRFLPGVREALEAHPLGRRIALIEGDSKAKEVVAEVARRIGGPGPHVFALDSDHSTEHVLAELEAYSPLVTRFGKIVVFDTSMSLCPRYRASNPHLAVKAFLAAHPEWRISPWAGASFVSNCEDGILERLP